MAKHKIYMDMCCFNRPYDDQQQTRIHLESLAKLHLQQMIVNGKLDFVWSYILDYENSKNPFVLKKETINKFSFRCVQYVDKSNAEDVEKIAHGFVLNGIKENDALHIACAIYASCDFFITTDDKLLRYDTKAIKIINPMLYIYETEGIE